MARDSGKFTASFDSTFSPSVSESKFIKFEPFSFESVTL